MAALLLSRRSKKITSRKLSFAWQECRVTTSSTIKSRYPSRAGFSLHWASCLFAGPRAKLKTRKICKFNDVHGAVKISCVLITWWLKIEAIVTFRRMCFCSIYRFGLMTVQIKVHVREIRILTSIKLLARELLWSKLGTLETVSIIYEWQLSFVP